MQRIIRWQRKAENNERNKAFFLRRRLSCCLHLFSPLCRWPCHHPPFVVAILCHRPLLCCHLCTIPILIYVGQAIALKWPEKKSLLPSRPRKINKWMIFLAASIMRLMVYPLPIPHNLLISPPPPFHWAANKALSNGSIQCINSCATQLNTVQTYTSHYGLPEDRRRNTLYSSWRLSSQLLLVFEQQCHKILRQPPANPLSTRKPSDGRLCQIPGKQDNHHRSCATHPAD